MLPVLQADVVATADISETPRGDGTRGETVRVAVYRRFIRHGSLRDALHRVTDPSQPHHAKYDDANAKPELLSKGSPNGSPENSVHGGSAAAAAAAAANAADPSGGVLRSAMPLPAQLVALYGRQVLEAMTYLAGTGVPTVHVHAGNVLLEHAPATGAAGVCRVAEWELALLRAPAPALTLGLL